MEALLFNVMVKTFPCIAGRTIYDPGFLTPVSSQVYLLFKVRRSSRQSDRRVYLPRALSTLLNLYRFFPNDPGLLVGFCVRGFLYTKEFAKRRVLLNTQFIDLVL